jgi:hypothetical protein
MFKIWNIQNLINLVMYRVISDSMIKNVCSVQDII